MRVYLSIIILIFCFQSWTKAENLSDFQIEGISVGDSLLNYFNDAVIIENKVNIVNGKFYHTNITDTKFKEYDAVSFYLKTNDDKYIIYAISALIFFDNQIDKCKIKKKKVLNDIEKLFKTKFITENGYHELDNKSKIYQSYFQYKNGSNVRVECYDWINKTKKNIILLIILVFL